MLPTDCNAERNGGNRDRPGLRKMPAEARAVCAHGHELTRGDAMPINMVYCRFRNTLEALQECLDTLDEPGHEYPSDEEREAARRLFWLCAQMVADYFLRHKCGDKA